MKKNRIRLCAGVLATVLAISGCSGAGSLGSSEPVNPIDVTERHDVEDTLHKVNVTESDRPFVQNNASEYKIIAGEDEHTQKAASYLALYIERATGCMLETATPEEYSADGKYIVLNVPELFTAAGLEMPEEDLGLVGYYIKSVNDNVFMASNYGQGARFAMLAFLRNVLGFKMYALDAVIFEKDGTTLPDMDIVEKPDVSYWCRMHNSGDEAEETYMMGFIPYAEGFASEYGQIFHNSLHYLPMEKYQAEHPGWYSTEGTDLCYTARGDEAELELMTDLIAERMLSAIEMCPDAFVVTCTIMDHSDVCLCDTCKASAEQYNGANSAAVVKFTNKINEKVQAELQRQADEAGTKKRPMTVMFFAYTSMTQPPAVQNEDGTWSPIDESVVCDEEVAVYYAPINANFPYSFYDEQNQEYYDALNGWAACTDEVYYWLYETNFQYYMYPYNSWDSMYETYRFCADIGAPFMMSQGQHNAQASTAFSDFKDYMNSCAIFDINVDYNAVMDDYFENYYLDAEEPMRQYFDEMRAWMRHLEETYPTEINGNIYEEIGKAKFWPQNLLEHWLQLIDEAYAAAEAYKDDKGLYESLVNRIKKESIFPRYALIEFYSGNYSAEEVNDMKYSFKEDAEKLSFSRVKEGNGGEITELWARWGIQ